MTDAFDDGELRATSAALRAEWRDDEEAWTRAAFDRWEHGRTLVDIARECMHRGDTVMVTTAHVLLRGAIRAVGPDTVRLVDDEGMVDVHLADDSPIVLRVFTRARSGGSRCFDDACAFRARLLEHETARSVELGTYEFPDVLEGELRVGADHVRVRSRDAGDTFVPLRTVAWVRGTRS